MADRGNWLAKARAKKAGWRASEIARLYRAWGFREEPGGRDTKYVHKDHAELIAYVTRSSEEISKGYVSDALELMEELLRRGYEV
ncbi:MAG: hypothetical protein ACRDHE_00945 [Ktedonobacterales bacterium]